MRHDDLVVDVVLLVVRLVHGLVGKRLRLGVLRQPLQPSGFDAVTDLHDYVAHEPDAQHHAHHVQLLPGAQVRTVRVRDHEARRLPQPVVAERRLLVAPEQRPVDTCGQTRRTCKIFMWGGVLKDYSERSLRTWGRGGKIDLPSVVD